MINVWKAVEMWRSRWQAGQSPGSYGEDLSRPAEDLNQRCKKHS